MKRRNVINIVHFVRGQDCRFGNRPLFDTFLEEMKIQRQYDMPYTFLLQYDAMIRPEYVEAIRANDDPNMEVGVWLEFCKELISDKLGLPWHGRPGYDWDWFVDPDMTVAYPPETRKIILDEIMREYHELFGTYPKAVGSWLFDAVTVGYLSETYGVAAFCNCKEQVGTDGYTLWGGYYNQGYYPAKKNMLSPAQTEAGQIGSPIFRMLGVDPIRQYESGLDGNWNPAKMQQVYTIEPACACGKDPEFIDWYLTECFESGALSFANVQVGQENSFIWPMIREGWELQAAKISEGFRSGRFEVEKLSDTGRYFKETYKETPATAVSALRDFENSGKQSVWYNCKNYRINFYRDDEWFGVRDAFLFDENYEERYLHATASGNYAEYDTLPVIDGYHWGGDGIRAFLQITRADGTPVGETKILSADGNDPELTVCLTADGEKIECLCTPDRVEIKPAGTGKAAPRVASNAGNGAENADERTELDTGSALNGNVDTAESEKFYTGGTETERVDTDHTANACGGFALRFTYRSTGETAFTVTPDGFAFSHRGFPYEITCGKAPTATDAHTVTIPLGDGVTFRRKN